MSPEAVIWWQRLCETMLVVGLLTGRHGPTLPSPGATSSAPIWQVGAPCLRYWTMSLLSVPPNGDDWLGVSAESLTVDAVHDWAVLPGCGAVVTFSGTVRDHSEEMTGVERLEYEVWEDRALTRLEDLAREIRSRWPDVGRVAMIHRSGSVGLSGISVLVVVSAPHRSEAFEAARFGIDMMKATLPIWKRECGVHGERWSKGCTHVIDIDQVGTI